MTKCFAVALICFGILTSADRAIAQTRTAIETTRSITISGASQVLPGVPLQAVDAPIAIVSCSFNYARPVGAADQSVTFHFEVLNRTGEAYREVTVDYRYASISYAFADIDDLKPYEYREVVVRFPYHASLFEHFPPKFFLCGAGPAWDAAGKKVDFLPTFFRQP